MSIVTIHQAKTNLSRLIEKASEGEEVNLVPAIEEAVRRHAA
jgi:antitoxin (DNA-binding transcriptional repressor) of toxin-antitoxin stability system